MSDAIAAALAKRATVELDTVRPAASWHRRVDRKYLVDPDVAACVIADLSETWLLVDIDGLQSVHYDNVYFDTPDRRLHRAAAQRHRRRVKLRTRRYGTGSEATTVAEAKFKGGRGETLKLRTSTEDELHGTIDALRPLTDLEAVQLRLDTLDVDLDELVPSISTSYRRSTLANDSGARVTLDLDVVCRMLSGKLSVESVVIETKSPGPPTDVDRLLWSRHLRPVRFSKCATAMGLLDDGCAGNRWHSTVRRHQLQTSGHHGAQRGAASDRSWS